MEKTGAEILVEIAEANSKRVQPWPALTCLYCLHAYIVGPCISFEEHFCCVPFPSFSNWSWRRWLLLLEKLVDLARVVYGWNKFRKFSSTCPSVFRPFTAPATAPYLGGPFSGPWDVCSLLIRIASSNNYKFTAVSRKVAMFPTKTGQQRRNKLT